MYVDLNSMQKQSTGLRSSAAFLELARAPFSAALALNMLSASYTNAMPSVRVEALVQKDLVRKV